MSAAALKPTAMADMSFARWICRFAKSNDAAHESGVGFFGIYTSTCFLLFECLTIRQDLPEILKESPDAFMIFSAELSKSI